jgi:hypothetical protein
VIAVILAVMALAVIFDPGLRIGSSPHYYPTTCLQPAPEPHNDSVVTRKIDRAAAGLERGGLDSILLMHSFVSRCAGMRAGTFKPSNLNEHYGKGA